MLGVFCAIVDMVAKASAPAPMPGPALMPFLAPLPTSNLSRTPAVGPAATPAPAPAPTPVPLRASTSTSNLSPENDEFRLWRGRVLGTINTAPFFTLKFWIYPLSENGNHWSNILHFTVDGESCSACRIPRIDMRPRSTVPRIWMGDREATRWTGDIYKGLPINKWTEVTVSMQGTILDVYYGEQWVTSGVFADMVPGYTGVTVYAGNPWHSSAHADIDYVRYEVSGGFSSSLGHGHASAPSEGIR